MTGIDDYVLRILALTVIIGSPCYLAVRLRRRFFAFLAPPRAILAACVIALSVFFVVVSLLGAARLFALVPLTVSFTSLGLLAMLWRAPGRTVAETTRDGAGNSVRPPRGADGRLRPVIVSLSLVIVAVIAIQWIARVADALVHGVRALDSLLYHLPYAAHFVQTGRITDPVYFLADQPTPFYPRNLELVHAVGMLVFGSEFASAFVNLALLALLLLAAWCVGYGAGRGPVAVALAAVATAVPLIATTQAGGANVDLGPAAFGVACLALLVQTSNTRDQDGDGAAVRLLLLAGLAAGLAISCKISALPFFGLLTIAVFIRFRRLGAVRLARSWLAGLAVTGSFWYLLNIWHVGNPFPFVEIELGPLRLPAPDWSALAPIQASIAEQMQHSRSWAFFANGLATSFGPGWPLYLLLLAVGIVAALRSVDRTVVMLGVVTLGATLFYLVTPYTGGGPPGYPLFFTQGLRYAFTVLICGMMLVVFARGLRRPEVRCGALVVLLVLLALSYLPPNREYVLFVQFSAWPSEILWLQIGAMVALGGVLAWGLRWSAGTRYQALALAAAVVLVAVVVWPAQRQYVTARQDSGYGAPPSPLQPFLLPAYEFLSGVSGATVGYSGVLNAYPFVGPDLDNQAVYLARTTPHRGASDIVDCRIWMDELRAQRVDYVLIASLTGAGLVGPSEASQDRQLTWMRQAPGVREVVREAEPVQVGFDGLPGSSPPQAGAVFAVDLADLGDYSCGAP